MDCTSISNSKCRLENLQTLPNQPSTGHSYSWCSLIEPDPESWEQKHWEHFWNQHLQFSHKAPWCDIDAPEETECFVRSRLRWGRSRISWGRSLWWLYFPGLTTEAGVRKQVRAAREKHLASTSPQAGAAKQRDTEEHQLCMGSWITKHNCREGSVITAIA